MRPALQITLAATLLLSAVALWPRERPSLVHAVSPAGASVSSVAVAEAVRPRAVLEPMVVAPAVGDPFGRPELAAVVRPAPPVASVPAIPAPLPMAPSPAYRFVGRLVTPGGEEVVLLGRGSILAPVVVSVGTTLDDGYVVQALLPDAVRLSYPPLNLTVELPVTAPPSDAHTGALRR